jgi:S1-C subfamily serine protease
MADARRLDTRGRTTAGELGILTRPLTPALSSATGADHGVVVVWVTGPAASHVAVGDVIESLNGEPVTGSRDWAGRTGSLLPGHKVDLVLRRARELRTIALMTVAPGARAANGLGLTLQSVPAVGSEVIRIEPGSAAYRAGMMPGDFITAVGSSIAPGPAEVHRAFSRARIGQAILLGINRGGARDVIAVTK